MIASIGNNQATVVVERPTVTPLKYDLVLGSGDDHVFYTQGLFSRLFIPNTHPYFMRRGLCEFTGIRTSVCFDNSYRTFRHVKEKPLEEELERILDEAEAIGETVQSIEPLAREKYQYHKHQHFPTDPHNPEKSYRFRHTERCSRQHILGRSVIPEAYVILNLNDNGERVRRMFEGMQPVDVEIGDGTETVYGWSPSKHQNQEYLLEDSRVREKFWFVIRNLFEDSPIDFMLFDPKFHDTSLETREGFLRIDYGAYASRASSLERVAHNENNGRRCEDHYLSVEDQGVHAQVRFRVWRFASQEALDGWAYPETPASFPFLWTRYPSRFQVIWDPVESLAIGDVHRMVSEYKLPIRF